MELHVVEIIIIPLDVKQHVRFMVFFFYHEGHKVKPKGTQRVNSILCAT